MALQAELVKRGIWFKLFGGRKFYESAHVRDAISYLRIVANPTDELAWHRVLLLLPGIGVRVVDAPKKSAAPVRASWARKE